VLEELFHDEASGGEDNESESSWELSDDAEKMSALSSENPDDSRRSCRVWQSADFWATVCKTVRPILSDRCLSVCLSYLSVCNLGVLRPNSRALSQIIYLSIYPLGRGPAYSGPIR